SQCVEPVGVHRAPQHHRRTVRRGAERGALAAPAGLVLVAPAVLEAPQRLPEQRIEEDPEAEVRAREDPFLALDVEREERLGGDALRALGEALGSDAVGASGEEALPGERAVVAVEGEQPGADLAAELA